jgi:uncharacterized membrane protein YgaE (UPF0421/DUF939 family)
MTRVYAIYFLVAVIFAYVTSQSGLLATVIAIALTLSGILLWRKKCPHDFVTPSYYIRVFVSVMYAVIFLFSFLIVRKTQATNYRANNLAALAIFFLLLAIYFGFVGRRKPLH